MSGGKRVEKDHYLFREGDPPDAMYVIKSGKFAVCKTKNNSEIVLAEMGPGAMVGEMAFFDNKPRSASVKAIKEGDVIMLPYKALHAQFANMPEWAKAIMRTVNDHLRNANRRIKELERATTDDEELFPPHTITKLVSILNLVGERYGTSSPEGLSIPGGTLRNYTIQIFQEPTHKMQKLMSSLAEQGLMKIEELGEGRQKIIVNQPEVLFGFVEWYNEWLFKKEADRILVKEEELRVYRGALHFAKKKLADEKGYVRVNLTELQNDSMRELGYLLKVEELQLLVAAKIMTEQMMETKGIYANVLIAELEKIVPYWTIVYTLRKIRK
ncbi:MAG: porin [Bdellovibrio sp.]|nr:MAG: porin [Bdellovibrio sp.]